MGAKVEGGGPEGYLVSSLQLEAVRAFVRTGSLAATSRELGIPMLDLTNWVKSVWWQEETTILIKQMKAAEEMVLTKILGTTAEAMLDRVINGEYVKHGKSGLPLVDKETGVHMRMPLKAQDLARVSQVVFTQRQLLRNDPTTIPGDTDKMKTLAEKLKALGAKDISVIEEVPTGPKGRRSEDTLGDGDAQEA